MYTQKTKNKYQETTTEQYGGKDRPKEKANKA